MEWNKSAKKSKQKHLELKTILKFNFIKLIGIMSDLKKVIEIDKSSLVTLKAEVFRLKKSEELKTRDHNPVKKINSSKIISSSSTPVNNLKAIEVDDSIELARSKRILEQKAKYYERMSKNKVNSTLVLFENKKDEDIRDETDL